MPFLRVIAWLNLVGNLLIVGTGGAVRLTDSGLGCPTAPKCTPESWVPTPELGIHGLIEFSNRMMSVVLGVLVLLAVVAVWRFGWSRRDLWVHVIGVLAGIVLQIFIGQIIVLTHLEVSTVGVHYLISMVLVGVCASFVLRTYRTGEPRVRATPGWMLGVTHLASALLLATVVLGVLTTGAGPHSGDKDVIRDMSAWENLVHIHAWIGYALAAALVAVLVGALATRQRRYLVAVLLAIAIVAVQIAVGLAQANLGIPALLVGIHMVLAGITVALTVNLVDATKRPAPLPSAASDPTSSAS